MASTSPQDAKGMQPVAAVLFDMDGLLLDTEGAYTIAQQRILDRFGRTFTWEHKAAMMGRQAREAAQVLLDAVALGPQEITPEQFLAERDALLESVFPESPLMPGAERLVRHLAASGVPIAVATGSSRPAFDLKTSRHGELFSLFSHVITGDMVTRAKPDPEIFLRALDGFKQGVSSSSSGSTQQNGDPQHSQAEAATTTPVVNHGSPQGRPPPELDGDMSRVLVFEDAPNGVQAALAGGMRVVMVPYPGMPEELTRGCGATQLLGSLEQFVPEEWGLPPYPK